VRAAPLTHIPPGDYRLIINATSSGLTEAALAVPDALFAGAAFAYDMVYGHRTAFLAQAARLAVANADGLGMLVEQAAAAFEIWHGIRPDTAPVLAALRGP
jgi:shikimate dehydrogenase